MTKIKEVKIDDEGRLRIYPETERFTLIYRTATEAHWDDEGLFLYSPNPREWSYLDWFEHIIRIARDETYCKLILTENTQWVNIPIDIKKQIRIV